MPNKFLDVLPDPNYKITGAGFEDSSGVAGLDFAEIRLSAMRPVEEDYTISGKLISRSKIMHKWIVTINYNPMTKAEFDPVHNFLIQKRGSLKPFYISLPQYKEPTDSLFITHVQNSGTSIDTGSSTNIAGDSAILITDSAWSSNDYSSTGLPSMGDLFNIIDSNDTLHIKTYMITRVETFDDYKTGNQPTTGHLRIHFSPGLQKDTAINADIIFDNPLIQVTQTRDVLEHNLDTENLYSFNVQLKEALY